MARASAATRSKIIDAAYGLFYRKGYARVGMDEIADQSKLTKRTLYYHYRSKDELLAAVLEHHHGLALARVTKHAERYAGHVGRIIEAKFEDLVTWSLTRGWTGSGFTRIVMELADLPGHPARDIARRHKRINENWWADRFRESGIAAPEERAREISLLMEGTIAAILVSGDRSYARTAARAAGMLLAQSEPQTEIMRATRVRPARPRKSARSAR